MPTKNLIKIGFFALMILAVGLEVVADVAFKKWAASEKMPLFWAGLFIYAVGTVFWAISLKYELLSKAITIFTILNLIAVVLVGVLLFKETLSITNKIGIALGVVSVFLIEL